MLGWFDIYGAVWVSAERTQTCVILLVLPSSLTDLLKEVLPPLNCGYVADSILVVKRDDVIVANIIWFENYFWVFIPPFF